MTTGDRRYVAALQAEQLKRWARRSLRGFVEQAWPILEPTTPFLPNWHIDLICEYLEAVTAGDLTQLVINIPPRYMKSLLVVGDVAGMGVAAVARKPLGVRQSQ